MLEDTAIPFNQQQKEAIEYVNGPLLIIAGAGTGKTHALVGKITYLIKKNITKPQEILALTFTEKAASEMEERVDAAIPYGYFQMWISTFHAFADQILKEEATHIGLPANYKLMTEAETVLFLRHNLFLFNLKYFRPLGNPNKFLEALLTHFSRLKDEDVGPKDYIKWANSLKKNNDLSIEEKEKYIELSEAYEKYQQLKIKEGVVDFSDLVFYLLELFRKRANILEKYRNQFRFVLVDEFQDTNIAQYELIKLLCPAKHNPKLTVVGDDSQAIYKFRGASVSNILFFMKDYPKAKQVTLKKNYRSNQTILNNSYRLIKHNDPDTLEAQLKISKNLIAQKPDEKDAVNFFLAKTIEEEADYVATEILKLKKTYKFSDIALLVRANNYSDAFMRTFIRNGIPYQFLGPGMLFKQPEVKDLIAYLKILSDLTDSVSMYRVLTMDIFNLDPKDISLLLSFSKRTNLSLFQAIEVYLSFSQDSMINHEFDNYRRYLPLLTMQTKIQLLNLYKMINRHLAMLKKETAGQILYYFLEDSKYLSKIVSYKTEKEEKIALNISKFFDKLKAFEAEHEDASVFAAVEYLDMSMELGESPLVGKTDIASYDAVTILTVHSAKGLEFPVVFMVNLSSGRFPTFQRREPIDIPKELIKEVLPQGDYHLEEERRLFYVGLTRAMDKIFLSSSELYGEGKRIRKVSPFVFETLGEEEIKKHLAKKNEEKEQLSIFDFKKTITETVVRQRLPLTHFSYSQIETYKTCPLQYKYRYVLKIPTTPGSAASFGDTIHKTLQQFYLEYLSNPKVDEKKMLEIFKKMWIPLGYASQAHEKRMKEEGQNMLKRFYETFHKGDIEIIDLEKLFKIKVDNDIFITGKIDRVDAKKNGEIEIIDYKTGRKPDKKALEKSLQLSVYALAAIDEGLYQKKLNQVTLTFYFLQDMDKVSIKRNPQDILELTDKIKKTAGEIRGAEFLPNVGPWCDFCPFRMICEAWQ